MRRGALRENCYPKDSSTRLVTVYTLHVMSEVFARPRAFGGSPASIILLLATQIVVSGCSDKPDRPPSVTGPTAPTGAVSTLTGEFIRGSASDSAFRPLPGARIEILDGPHAGTSTIADGRGEFQFTATIDDATRFRASKEGHVAAIRTTRPCAECRPSRWVHFYLDLLEPPVNLSGDYTLTLTADPACATLPEELRTRTYDTTIRPDIGAQAVPPSTPTSFSVIPKGPTFADHIGFFYVNVAGSFVNLSLGDHTDPGIAERVAPNTYYAFGGSAKLTVTAPVTTISTPFEGWIDHCALSTPMGPRYRCSREIATTYTRCDSRNHHMTLTRR